MKSFLHSIRDLLFPPKCAACGKLLDWYDIRTNDSVLCEDCRKKWENESLETCGSCAKTVSVCTCLTEELKHARCAAFRKLVYYSHGTRNTVPNRLIYHIKQVRNARTMSFLAHALLPALRELQTEYGAEDAVLTFVPRGRSAKLEYGTDQAEALARALSKASGVPMRTCICRRRKSRAAQKTLSAKERARNAKESFSVMRGIELTGKSIFLVDDIVTTGASMAACARVLRQAGAKQVFCLAVASDDMNKDCGVPLKSASKSLKK